MPTAERPRRVASRRLGRGPCVDPAGGARIAARVEAGVLSVVRPFEGAVEWILAAPTLAHVHPHCSCVQCAVPDGIGTQAGGGSYKATIARLSDVRVLHMRRQRGKGPGDSPPTTLIRNLFRNDCVRIAQR